MNCSYLINMDDGRLIFRNEESDCHINLRPVPDEVVAMIVSGEVKAKDVINAISAKIKENGEFNLHDYTEALKKLNVRTSLPQVPQEREELKDRSEEMVSIEDVKNSVEKRISAPKRERMRKINAVLDGESSSL